MPEQSLTITTDRETIEAWLRSKRVTLWSDWCITHPDSMDKAVNWFLGEMQELSQYEAQTDDPARSKENPAGLPAHILERQRVAA